MSLETLRSYLLSNVLRDGAGEQSGAAGAGADGGKKEPAAGAAGAGDGQGAGKDGQGADKGAQSNAGVGADGKQAGEEGAGKTIADGKGAEGDGAKVIHADFPQDWRQKFAGANKAALTKLERYDSPVAVWNALESLSQRVSSGELKASTPFPDKGTPEQQAAWRTEQGVPDKPEGYEPKLPDGVVLGEADKPIVSSFQHFAHGKNWTPGQFNDALGWYYGEQDKQLVAQADADDTFHTQSNDALHAKWGNDYRPNVNAIGNLFSDAPKGLFDRFMTARFSDDKKNLIGDDPETLEFLSRLGRERYPTATILPLGGKTVTDRLTEIRAMLKNDPDKYWGDPKIQAEHTELNEAELRMKGRKSA